MTSRLRRYPVVRHVLIRPRLVCSILAAALVYAALPIVVHTHAQARFLIAYDAGVCIYLGLAMHLIATASHASMRHRARVQDDGQAAILIGVVIGSIASLVAIAAQLSIAKDLQGPAKIGHIALAVLTIACSWAFTQMILALHYANAFYTAAAGRDAGGLAFPDGTTEPTYMDFLYVACVIGTSGQTADVSFASQRMRRIGLVHCIQAYAFNATLLGLTINIVAGLL